MAPIDKDLIDKRILNSSEILWLNNYHKLVKKCLNKFMNKSEKIQLAKALLTYLTIYTNFPLSLYLF